MKKLISFFVCSLFLTGIFAQSAEYKSFLSSAKNFETKKQFVSALDAYYDAMACEDESALKKEAIDAYLKLSDSIRSGSLGLAIYDDAVFYEDWKRLLTDTEELQKTICKYELTLGQLSLIAADKETESNNCVAKISSNLSSRYKNTIEIVKSGYVKAYKNTWTDLPAPESWNNLLPIEKSDNYEFKFNIVDENGKELVKAKNWYFNGDNSIIFENLSSETKELIKAKKAFLNPVGVMLENEVTDSNEKKSSKTNLPLDRVTFHCWNNNYAAASTIFDETMALVRLEFYEFSELSNFYIGKTEVTQDLYEAVMGENPSKFKGCKLPVEKISWYDAIYFCNECSRLENLTPVYAVDGETDVTKWNYKPHKGKNLFGEITQNLNANGYRLPTSEEWEFASKGGQKFNYSGSENLQEVGWYFSNSNNKTHPVAQKNANAYDLYDMSGNVWEWVWEMHDEKLNLRCCRGGSWNNHSDNSKVISRYYKNENRRDDNLGIRLVRPNL